MPDLKPKYLQIKGRALYYLAKRDYSQIELKNKLQGFFPEAKTDIMQLIQELIEMHYLNDMRFLRGRVQHRLTQGYGPLKIKHELKSHGFQKQDIEKELQTLSQENTLGPDIDRLKMLIEKKYTAFNPEDSKIKARIMRYFLQRGFQYDEIKAALSRFKAQR